MKLTGFLSGHGSRLLRRRFFAALLLAMGFSGVGVIAVSMLGVSLGQVHAQTAKPSAVAAKNQPKPAILLDADDAEGRSKAIVAHLNAALRFYRDSQAPIQKVGEPSDLLYRDQAVTLAGQVAGFAFQSAKAEAAIMPQNPTEAQAAPESQSQRLQEVRKTVEQQVAALKAQDAALTTQLQTAKPRDAAALQQKKEQVDGELELQTAMGEALARITSSSDSGSDVGFSAQIVQLERSAPGLAAGKPTSVAPTLENITAAHSEGVTTQAQYLFQLVSARQDIDNLVKEADDLHAQALALRQPLTDTLRKTIAQGQALSQQVAAPAANGAGTTAAKPGAQASAAEATAELASTRKNFDTLTATFKGLAAASVPLSQEALALEQAHASLEAWRAAVNQEYTSLRWSLLVRVFAIAIALAVIFILGEVWRRATTRYVRDVRRRRQLLVLRRLAVGFLSGLVMIFGLVTQFSSLATFAGFITAGIAVGLQTILLSVAAYFFIIGRYGVKVGDRITITGVTGEVIEVGLVRFYMLEMSGNGTDLYPTGRVAVFSNAVLFQAGTPLYKQMPGTDYAWHELTLKLTPGVDYRAAVQEILKTVQTIYESYKGQIEQQHRSLESWIDSSLDSPEIQSNLQLVDAGFVLLIRFPVIIRQSWEIDDKVTHAVLQLTSNDPNIKSVVAGAPTIKAAVRG
jgi:small-conductance mechanosensitive channel